MNCNLQPISPDNLNALALAEAAKREEEAQAMRMLLDKNPIEIVFIPSQSKAGIARGSLIQWMNADSMADPVGYCEANWYTPYSGAVSFLPGVEQRTFDATTFVNFALKRITRQAPDWLESEAAAPLPGISGCDRYSYPYACDTEALPPGWLRITVQGLEYCFPYYEAVRLLKRVEFPEGMEYKHLLSLLGSTLGIATYQKNWDSHEPPEKEVVDLQIVRLKKRLTQLLGESEANKSSVLYWIAGADGLEDGICWIRFNWYGWLASKCGGEAAPAGVFCGAKTSEALEVLEQMQLPQRAGLPTRVMATLDALLPITTNWQNKG